MSYSRSVTSRRHRSFATAVAMAGLIGTMSTVSSYAQTSKQPINFPSGYDFPATDLQNKVNHRDTSGLRRHGWYLWAGVNQPGRDGWPVWASWPIATQVFAPPLTAASTAPASAAGAGRSLAAFNALHMANTNIAPPFYAVPASVAKKYKMPADTKSAHFCDGDTFQNNGDVMLVSEAYNEPAFQWIRKKALYERDILTALQDHLPYPSMPDMPADSIVLKYMYWPVTKDGLTALPIVDMSKYRHEQPAYVGFEDQTQWRQAVAIDPSGRFVGQTKPVSYLYDVALKPALTPPSPPRQGPVKYFDAKVVSLSDFYYKKLSQSEFDALSRRDRILIDSSFYWAHGRLFQDGDYLVAIASHIITKEIRWWTLQTVWWHPDANSGEFASDRPEIRTAKGPWAHYLLAVEDGIPDALDPTQLPVIYNPYIELAADHAVHTNCRSCHMRASLKGQYPAEGTKDALALINFFNPTFKNNLRTDFLWTIPDRAIPTPPPACSQ